MVKTVDGFKMNVNSRGGGWAKNESADAWDSLKDEAVVDKKQELKQILGTTEKNTLFSDDYKQFIKGLVEFSLALGQEINETGKIASVGQSETMGETSQSVNVGQKVQVKKGAEIHVNSLQNKVRKREIGAVAVDGVMRRTESATGQNRGKDQESLTAEKLQEPEKKDAEQTDKIGLVPFLNDKKQNLRVDNSLLKFLVSSEKGYTIKTDEAVDKFREMVENAKPDEKEFKEARFLGSAIIDAGRDKFTDQEIEEVLRVKNSPLYQEKEFRMYIADADKGLEIAREHLVRCQNAVKQAKKGGPLKRGERKTAEMQQEWVEGRIKDLKETKKFYEQKLATMPDWAKKMEQFDGQKVVAQPNVVGEDLAEVA